ncbi:MAG: hypothetical protein K2X11_21240 [Acetobacteraceae bacterium]|nr:hypothetical protein [Acetobacteraceae bacterium]
MSRLAVLCAVIGAAALLAACSPSFGGGSPSREVIVLPPGATVLPPGARIVCADGRAPPC